jgi:hypothetical protein
MRYLRLVLLLASITFYLASCKKEALNSSCNCNDLREGLLTNDTKRVAKSLESMLTSYSESNLNELAATITDHCNIPATVDCFNCIKTNPPQTEIVFALAQAANTVQKRLDISYAPDNKMRILNVHD